MEEIAASNLPGVNGFGYLSRGTVSFHGALITLKTKDCREWTLSLVSDRGQLKDTGFAHSKISLNVLEKFIEFSKS